MLDVSRRLAMLFDLSGNDPTYWVRAREGLFGNDLSGNDSVCDALTR